MTAKTRAIISHVRRLGHAQSGWPSCGAHFAEACVYKLFHAKAKQTYSIKFVV